MKQLKIAFDEPLKRRLEATAKASGKSMADEVRARLVRTFEADAADRESEALLTSIAHVMDYVQVQTGWPWHEDPFAHDVLRHAVVSLVDRARPREAPAGPPPHDPISLVASTDPHVVGVALETLAISSPPAVSGWFGPGGFREFAAPTWGSAATRAAKEAADKANPKIRTRGNRGKS